MLEELKTLPQDQISIETLSEITGLPQELICQEIFGSKLSADSKVSMSELRLAMLKYLDQTMLDPSN